MSVTLDFLREHFFFPEVHGSAESVKRNPSKEDTFWGTGNGFVRIFC